MDSLQIWADEVCRELEAADYEWGDIYYSITDEEDRERTLNEVNSDTADFYVKKDGHWILFIAIETTGKWEYWIKE